MRYIASSERAGKHNKVHAACVCVRDGYVLSNNGSDNAWIVSTFFIPPNPYRPGYKLRPVGYNGKRFDKRRNLYDFNITISDISTEDGI